MGLMLQLHEKVYLKGRTMTVTDLAFDDLPRIRDYLIDVARRGRTTTYGQLRADLALRHPVNGLGRLLDLLSEDCHRRREPSLAALVVNAQTNEVGNDFDGDPVEARRQVHRYWQ